MKLDNISFSSPKIICVSRDITCGCPYDIHGIALKLNGVSLFKGHLEMYVCQIVIGRNLRAS